MMRWGTQARRRPFRLRPAYVRRAMLALCLWPTVMVAAATAGQDTRITAAAYAEPTTRYGHGVLGDKVEYGALLVTLRHRPRIGVSATPAAHTTEILVRLPSDHVFEDIAPRLADVDGDGRPEVLVVETDVNRGAQLAIYDAQGRKMAATPHIGQRNRWLAPVGAADLDGDGHIEIAYVDRPHLAKTLRVWRLKDGELSEIGHLPGLTNHRIGDDFIMSGIRDCGDGFEMITADETWSWVMATRIDRGKLHSRRLAPFAGPGSVADALACH